MKSKTIIAITVALLMIASSVSASFISDLFLGNKQVGAGLDTFAEKNTNAGMQNIVTTPAASATAERKACTKAGDCPGSNCVCRCSGITAVTPSVSASIPAASSTVVAATPTATAVKPATAPAIKIAVPSLTSATGKAIALPIPSTASKTVASSSTAATLPTGTATALRANNATCTANANCTSGYCKTRVATTSAAVTKICAPCTTNAQCGTGKVCFEAVERSGQGVCIPPLEIGRGCTKDSQCRSNYCNITAITGSAAVGTCAVRPASIAVSAPAAELTAMVPPTRGTKGEGEICTNCASECSTGVYTCGCEVSGAMAAAPSLVMQQKSLTAEALPAETPEIQLQKRNKILQIEQKLTEIEQQAMTDGLMAENEPRTKCPSCFRQTADLSLMEEHVKTRAKNLIEALEANGISAAEAEKFRADVGIPKENVQAKSAVAEKAPSMGFIGTIKSMFGFKPAITGKVAAADTSAAISSGISTSTTETISAVPINPAVYKAEADTIYNNLSLLEKAICAKFDSSIGPTAGTGTGCSLDSDCSSSGAVKCVQPAGSSIKVCRAEKKDICHVDIGVVTAILNTAVIQKPAIRSIWGVRI